MLWARRSEERQGGFFGTVVGWPMGAVIGAALAALLGHEIEEANDK
jgi:hypothetical protein